MAKQPPTLTNPTDAARISRAELPWSGYTASIAHSGSRVVRERVLPGETERQAKARWAREREVERERDMDPRVSSAGGRVMPVRYDD